VPYLSARFLPGIIKSELPVIRFSFHIDIYSNVICQEKITGHNDPGIIENT
jgi:hypothetical protein